MMVVAEDHSGKGSVWHQSSELPTVIRTLIDEPWWNKIGESVWWCKDLSQNWKLEASGQFQTSAELVEIRKRLRLLYSDDH